MKKPAVQSDLPLRSLRQRKASARASADSESDVDDTHEWASTSHSASSASTVADDDVAGLVEDHESLDDLLLDGGREEAPAHAVVVAPEALLVVPSMASSSLASSLVVAALAAVQPCVQPKDRVPVVDDANDDDEFHAWASCCAWTGDGEVVPDFADVDKADTNAATAASAAVM
jgi:hypothetical protein